MNTLKPKSKRPISPGHRACAGCGELLAARTVTEALGSDIIVTNATGCLEVTTTPYPESSWGMPWIHSLFENAASVAAMFLTLEVAVTEIPKKEEPAMPGGGMPGMGGEF